VNAYVPPGPVVVVATDVPVESTKLGERQGSAYRRGEAPVPFTSS